MTTSRVTYITRIMQSQSFRHEYLIILSGLLLMLLKAGLILSSIRGYVVGSSYTFQKVAIWLAFWILL